jgi:hypothetical protein
MNANVNIESTISISTISKSKRSLLVMPASRYNWCLVITLIVCLLIFKCSNKNFYYSIAISSDGMSGGNLNRSLSLTDIRTGSTSLRQVVNSSNTVAARSFSTLPASSKEEGYALLSQHSPAVSTSDKRLDMGLLDYDSDGQDTTTEQMAAYHSDPSLQQLSAMDTGVRRDVEEGGAGIEDVPAETVIDPMYYQCCSARISCQKDTLVSVSVDESFGKRVVVNSPSVGTLEDHGQIDHTFHGSRVMRGNVTVNESLSSSFDPSKLVCISCESNHQIMDKKPVLFLFSDQNFVATVPGPNKDCLNVVRVENASLLELVNVAREILGNAPLPEGSILMFGSASHLSHMGTSAYARDWTEVVALSVETWHGVRVCPLIPLIVTDCTGTIVRELSEL